MNIHWRVRPAIGRAATVLAMGSLVVSLAGLAHADVKESQKCRGAIGKAGALLSKTVLKNIDKCQSTQIKAGAERGPCNVIGSIEFDSKGKYPLTLTKLDANIDKSCLPGDPVLANFPPDSDPVLTLFPAAEAALSGNSVYALGNGPLDPALAKCHQTVAKSRSSIINEIVKDTTKCQAGLDKVAVTFGPVAPSCVDAGDKGVAKALLGIPKACGATTGTALGICEPFPQCVIDSAVQAGQTVAREIYSHTAPVCGDGVISFPEQCDDSNTTSGDGCSSTCEVEGNSCSPLLAPRTVTVNVTASEPFAAADITLDYPQFQSGIPGTGQSSLVQNRITVNQGNPANYLFLANDRETDLKMGLASSEDEFNTGTLLTLAFDGCVALAENVCNRNQNVIGCCNGDGDDPVNCAFTPPVCTTFPLGSIGSGTPEDCCPADNACVTQVGATICNVSGAVNALGNPVSVSCSVVVNQ